MYTVRIQARDYPNTEQELLYDPRIKEYAIVSPTLTREANKLSTFTFTIYPDHPCYGKIILKRTMFYIYRNDEFICILRAIRCEQMMNGGLEYDCEEWLGIMDDYSAIPDGYGTLTTLDAVMSTIQYLYDEVKNPIGAYLYDIGITYGHPYPATSRFDSEVNEKKFAVSDYSGVFSVLSQYVLEKYNGYLFVVYDNTKWRDIGPNHNLHRGLIHYTYYAEDELPEGKQPIIFGKNLVNLFIETDSDDFFTRLIPLGKGKKTTNAQRNKGLPNSLPITVEGATNRDDRDLYKVSQREYIAFWNVVQQYGEIDKTIKWDDITTANKLYTKGLQYYIDNCGRFAKTVQLDAVDLADAGIDIENIEFMTRVYCESSLHGIRQRYLVYKQIIRLDNVQKNRITLGKLKPSLTDVSASSAKANASAINSVDDRVFYLENG